ncbi:C4-dicarboxylate ABC transporter permease [Limnohabitans sp. TS-CS-82]|uniref:TRAP transporter small permease n=1 Tax=Limnohabitans sp. TS-CS-82 TaxID=2094193 RepID=UPI000CF2B95F|nr:TRAP transporter small permease [Limnohabitans sp. TS-CS-82]PQA84362.1 C4-dicarboxylate ABC transporter permease [Limnohabitans sp. TS-CS-82]
MKTFERYFVATNRWMLIIMLAVMSVIIFANVVLRYSTNVSIEWAEEVARHLMIWLTFIGCGPVLRYGGHIAVENLQDSLPRPMAIALRAFIAVLLAALFVFLTWYGIDYMDRTQYQQTPATQISFAYIYAALPIGAAMTLIHWLLIVRDYVLERKFAADAHFDATASASL